MRGAAKKVARSADTLDPQRQAVYDWEDSWPAWGANDLTLQGCRDAVRWACMLYDVPVPRVKQHQTEAMSECDVRIGVIDMQAKARRPGRGGKNASQALHEAAHWIVYQRLSDKPQDHGPTFMGVYIHLLSAYGVAPAAALLPSARKFGLKWRWLS
jgi:hypothetical protein